jgi:hypothetical protein
VLGCNVLAGKGPRHAVGVAGGVSSVAVITMGTSAVIALVPDAGNGGSSCTSNHEILSKLGELPGGCEERPCVGADEARGGSMLVGASLNGGGVITLCVLHFAPHT